jgi:putative nucleotidyltransferase with HDIG domain
MMTTSTRLIVTEQELLDLSEAQEQAEWGHAGHGRGVARIAQYLAGSLRLPNSTIETLTRAALLHDVGKIKVNSNLWSSLEKLRPEQRKVLEAHSQCGAELAAQVGLPLSIQRAILHHHERWDGRGYPHGLKGDAIPIGARILCVAEQVDSLMRSTYRRDSVTHDQMLTIVAARTGREWDPHLAKIVSPILRGR